MFFSLEYNRIMGVTDVLKQDIAEKVKYIKENFTRYTDSAGTTQYVLSGYLTDQTASGANKSQIFGTTTPLRSIIDYSDFKTVGISTSCTPTAADEQPYAYSSGNWNQVAFAANSIDSNATTKYNLTGFFKATNCGTSLSQLNAIHMNYDLLRNNWGNFKNLLSVTLKPYDKSGVSTWIGKYSATSGNVYSSSSSPDIHTGFDLDKAVDYNEINLFVCQRILYLFIIVAEIYAAMYMWEKYIYPGGGALDITTKLQNLLLNRLNTLAKINDDFAKGSDTDISKRLDSEYNKYKTNQDTINNAKVDLERIQLDLANNKSYMDSQSKIAKKMSNLSMISWSVGILVIIAILTVYFVPLEPAQKRATMISLFAFGALLCLMFYFIGRSIQKEAFVGSFSDLTNLQGNTTEINKNTYNTETIYPFVLQQMSEYLNNTIMIASKLQTTQVYLNVNDAMTQQANYYDNTLKQMDLGSEKADNLAKILYLDSTVAYSNVIFVIGLLLIISVAALLLIAVKAEGTRTIIYIISGILLLILCIIYVLRIAPRVRTDGRKYYWGKPAMFSKS